MHRLTLGQAGSSVELCFLLHNSVVRACVSEVLCSHMTEYRADSCTYLCRVQYAPDHQQQLIAALRSLSTTGNSSLPTLLQANALISDIMALSFSDSIDPGAILDVAAAVAAAPASESGFGLYLLVMPVVEALQQLAFASKVRP